MTMKTFKFTFSHVLIAFTFIFILSVLSLSVRGIMGVPDSKQLSSSEWKENGPFELSPERGRFALLYSVIEDKSLQFSNNIGKFAEPDVAVSKGRFVSLFAPLVSFTVAPGYIVGKYFGASQFGAYSVIALFAFFNAILIALISIKLGAHKWVSLIGSLVFIFATPAFAYGVNLYQHHLSTFLILLALYSLLLSQKLWSFFLVFFLCALAIPLDYPNVFFLFPIGIYAMSKTSLLSMSKEKLTLQLNLKKLLTVFAMIIPIAGFLLFNYLSYGNPFQLSGTLQTVENLNRGKEKISIENLKPTTEDKVVVKKSAVGSFKSRNILNGFYILFISPDRGVIFFTPIMLFGVFGLIMSVHKKIKLYPVLVATIGANVLLYSMWGDPWGGWAFGARYLIPSYALLSIFIALLLTYWKDKIWPYIVFIPLLLYSVAVNTLGAITTSAIPPKVEVLALEKISGTIQRYNYQRNWEFLMSGHSKSFAYQTWLSNYMTTLQFYELLTFSIVAVFGILFIAYFYTYKNSSISQ